jgi:hypothetical protein
MARVATVLERFWAYLVGFGMLGTVAAPGFRPPGDDSYPISTYPMFARPKAKTVLSFAEGVDASGRTRRLPPELVANDEPMQAAHTVRRAIDGGPERRERLCRRIAERVAQDPGLAAVLSVRLVQGRFDSVGYFLGESEPEERATHCECAVRRSPP